ncbi:MAG: methylenetetrahydrofolate reductase [NAD(P)H] [Deltaproteobacteria bacterium]|nr:methylenetetrahydrofolate reductase [NAD(P)H] [Deltaproteobacteria bacterium]MBW2661114.1 methylenetetrahydrofolate reductase [NAD(P)H] [Deltaproteobacteria bacterium]
MLVKDILNTGKISFSFEFFPPKTKEGMDKLFSTVSGLMSLKPSYFSITYGAGGSAHDYTYNLVVRIQKETGLTVVSHLTCIGSNRDEIKLFLGKSVESGVKNILALRGDLPKGQSEWANSKNGFAHAADLVGFIKKHFPDVCVGVAGFPEGHPMTPNRLKELEYLKTKVDAGADYIVTQLFFDNRDFYDFCERCELSGIHVPIVAGIMPITTSKGMIRMAELAGGARFPAGLLKSITNAQSSEQVENIGVQWATKQARDLINNNVRGVHFYTLNSSQAILRVFESLGVTQVDRLKAEDC